MNRQQQGFTLIELMISLTLGLIIIGAMAQVYLIGTRTSSIQQSASGVIDSNVFGMQQLENKLRLAGLGLSHKSASRQVGSGIIIYTPEKGQNASAADLKNTFGMDLEHHLATRDGEEINFLASNTEEKSDQLTIQYRAPVDMTDCEGKPALGPRYVRTSASTDANDLKRVDGQIVIESYFLSTDKHGQMNLYCDAGRYINEDIITDSKYKGPPLVKNKVINILDSREYYNNTFNTDSRAIAIANVDDFQILLGVLNADNTMRYIDAKSYYDHHRGETITAVKIAILARGATGVATVDAPEDPEFTLFGKNVFLKYDVPTNYVRRVYESTVMLRNQRGQE